MHQPSPLRLASWARLGALSLLLSFGLLAGGLLSSGTAHAQAATTITVSTCDESHLDAAIAQANTDNAGDTTPEKAGEGTREKRLQVNIGAVKGE